MTLRDAWDANAEQWIEWARRPGHDSYWQFHARRFFELVPPPGHLTVDLGCGEGRVSRDLVAHGHHVVAIDGSFTMAHACATGLSAESSEPSQMVSVGDAARAPLRSGVADLVVAFMSLQDVDDMAGAVREVARILTPGGRLCLAIVHPLNSAGSFEGKDLDAPFVIRGSYLDRFDYVDDVERDGLTMRFHSRHRPFDDYSRALENASFVLEAVREVTDEDEPSRWQRVPYFLHLRARRA